MDKSKLRPATPADLVAGNKIIVEDAKGVPIEGTVVLTLGGGNTGDIFVEGKHAINVVGEVEEVEADVHVFHELDFISGRHGDYGLKLWVKEPAEQATGTLSCVTGDYGPKISYVEVHDAKGRYLTGKLEGIRFGKLLVRITEEHFTTGMNSYSNRLWSIEARDFKDAGVAGLAEVCGIKFLFAAGEA